MSAEATRPTLDMTLLGIAALWAKRSTCSRSHVGAVLAVDSRCIASGYNGAPSGEPHCSHTCDCIYGMPLADRIHVCVHQKNCAAVQPCRVAQHAEGNAVAFAAKYGLPIAGSTLYTTLAPCRLCAVVLISVGVTRVVYGSLYRDPSGLAELVKAGVSCDYMRLR